MTVETSVSEETTPAAPPDTLSGSPSHETAQIARAASVIALGNTVSRVLGLVRETVKSHFFGAGGAVDAYNVATIVPTMMYDLLVGGAVDSSLVPVFSAYVAEKREELWGLVSVLLSLVVVALAAFILLVEAFAPQVAFLLSSGSSPAVLDLTARLLRITVPAVLFLNLSGVLSGLLYALKRFAFPAFAAAVFNAGIVAATLLFHNRLDISAMALGLLIGAILQFLLQVSGLRDARLRFRLTLRHPALRRIVTLYTPIVLGLLVEILISRPISYNLASQTGEGGISWMNYATYLRQLPQGLVATAISFAVLPTLSTHAARERRSRGEEKGAFQSMLAKGLRLVVVLIVPATVGLFILARPTVDLLFEHGDFLPFDTLMTTQALQFYLLGLPFAAIDLLLVFAFYARQDTLTPALIGVGVNVIYLGAAVALLPSWGLFSLMIADSLKQLLHALISGAILWKRLGGLSEHGLSRTVSLTSLSAGTMGLIAYGALRAVETLLPGGSAIAELL
ncbi:MAG TPA: murein biosynthesis integral membrane protein MurJ, partial [Chloroflexi bacterium]|nr:murein biosynthesis integral membrane protein MurJ [Chloroflexota bacterium]